MRNFNSHWWALVLSSALAFVLGGAWATEAVVGPPEPVRTQAIPQTTNTAPSFVVGGKVLTDGFNPNILYDGVQTGAGYLLAGMDYYGGILAKYNADGSLDSSFEGGIKAIPHIQQINALSLQGDGRILIGGTGASLFMLGTNGDIDSSFGNGGAALSGCESIQQIYITKSGKILAIGMKGNIFLCASRFSSSGILDASYANNGTLNTNIQLNSYTSTYEDFCSLQSGEKIVCASMSATQTAQVVRFDGNGILDTTFNGTGIKNLQILAYNGGKVGVYADDRLLIAWPGGQLVRLNNDGSFDASLGGGGMVYGGAGVVYTISTLYDGGFLLSGFSGAYPESDFMLAKFNSAGEIAFRRNIDFGGNDYAFGGILTDDSRLIMYGSALSYQNFAIARCFDDGSLDFSFGKPKNSLYYMPSAYEQVAIKLAPQAHIYDTELAALSSYDGATLNIARQDTKNSEDSFSAGDSLTALVPGSYFAIDGITIGQVINNSGGILKLKFMGINATQSRVSQTLQSIYYTNTSDRPPAQVLIDWTFDDGNTGAQGTGGALSTTGTVTVNITPVNDSPRLVNTPPQQTTVAGFAFSYTLPADTFTDPDGDSLTWSLTMADGTGVPPWLNFNPATRVLSGTPSEFDVGSLNLRVTVTDPSSAAASANFSVVVRAGVLSGLAAQGYVGIDNQVQFGAFTISGDSRRVLIRGLGPALDKYIDGAIRNPKIALSLNGATEPLVTNDDWEQAENAAEIESLKHQPANEVESAILTTLQPGVYNLHLSGSGDSTGIGMFQIYAVEGGGNGELRGLAAQGQVGTDNQVQFGTFTITGKPQRVLIRGLGPALNGYIPGAIGNPKIALSLNGALMPLEVNDDWADADNAEEIAALKHQPKNPTESAILRTLEPGIYNIHLSGSGGTTGIGMFQVYTVE